MTPLSAEAEAKQIIVRPPPEIFSLDSPMG